MFLRKTQKIKCAGDDAQLTAVAAKSCEILIILSMNLLNVEKNKANFSELFEFLRVS